MYRLAILLALLTLSLGCKKEKPGYSTPQPSYTYYISNETAHQLTLKVYATEDGYWGIDSVLLPYISVTLQPFQKNLLVPTTVKDTGILYADIYSPDYRYTNWYGRYSFRKKYTGDTITITKNDLADMGSLRRIFMKDKSRTVWKTFDAYHYSGYNLWQQLPAGQKNITLTLYKGWYAGTDKLFLSMNVLDLRFPPARSIQLAGHFMSVEPQVINNGPEVMGDTALLNIDTIHYRIARVRQ